MSKCSLCNKRILWMYNKMLEDAADDAMDVSPPRRSYKVVSDDQLPMRSKLLFESLIQFYNTNGAFETVVVPILRNKDPLPLRDIDWLVTNFSLAFPVVYENPMRSNSSSSSNNNNDTAEPFNLHDSYEQHEEAWKKKLFDPFQRGERVMFRNAAGDEHETTIAQLNFFRWAIQYGVIDWAAKNRDEIHKHHQMSKRARKQLIQDTPNREKKRMRLTPNDKAHCLVYIQPTRISLKPDDKKNTRAE